MKNVLIGILLVTVIVLVYLQFKPKPVTIIPATQTTDTQNNIKNTQQSTPPAQTWKTYDLNSINFQPIQFKYPNNAILEEKQFNGGKTITISVPFAKKYDVWTKKQVIISTRTGSCSDVAGILPSQTKTVNGITFYYSDPAWTDTSGMSSVMKKRDYYYEIFGKCYWISEQITGTGTNETPPTDTHPSNTESYLDAELTILDQIVATFKFTQ